MNAPRSLFDKIWDAHQVVAETEDHPAILYVDLQLLHEVTSPQAFDQLRERGVKIRRPDRNVATMDHSTPTLPPRPDGSRPYFGPAQKHQVEQLQANAAEFGVELHSWESPWRGVVHVMAPELGLTQPGMTVVCGDSHTATHGAFGALAFGIGTTEVAHVLATQTLLQRKAKSMAVNAVGRLTPGVSAKDLILAIIAKIGVGGGTGHVIEYRGQAVEALSMEERMTVCNMSIEGGARAGLIAPDQTTFDFLRGRERVPHGEAFERAVDRWRALPSDAEAAFDSEVTIDAALLGPMITWGVNPAMGGAIGAPLPYPTDATTRRAFDYMQVEPGRPVTGSKVAKVFVGSCTNGRLSDLQETARLLKGRKVAKGVQMLVVPGSESVKREAEALGLHEVFLAAGAEWREPGCSMCLAMNGDMGAPGELIVSTSNRNFEGRQGPGVRTMLASPATAAATAIAGVVADPRPMMEGR